MHSNISRVGFVGLILFAVVFFIYPQAHALNEQVNWKQANEYYKRGQYDSAAYFYQKSLEEGTDQNRLEVLHALIETYLKSGDYNDAFNLLVNAFSEANNPYWRNKLLVLQAKNHFSNGDPQRAIDIISPLWTSIVEIEVRADALNTLAKSQVWVGELESAKIFNSKADSLIQLLADQPPILMGDIHNVSGILFYFQGEYDKAIQAFKLALDAKKKVLYEFNPDVVSFYGNIGVMYKNKSQYEKALEYYGYEFEHLYTRLGEYHPHIATSYLNIGAILHAKGSHQLAIEAFEKALEIRTELMGADHALTLEIYEWLGNVNAAIGNNEIAEAQFRQVLEGRKKLFGENNHYTSLTFYNVGEILFFQKKYAESIPFFEKAIQIGEEIYEEASPDLASNYNGLGESLLMLNQIDDAKKNFYLAIEQSVPGFLWNGESNVVPDVIVYLRFSEIFQSLIGLAKTYSLEGDNQKLLVAKDCIKAAEKVLTEERNGFTEDKDRIMISAYAKQLAEVAISVEYKLLEQTNDPTCRQEIFRWSEWPKSSALLSSVSDNRAKEVSEIPDSLLALELKYRLMKDSLHNILISAEPEELKDIKTEIFDLSQKHSSLIDYLESNFPKYARQKYGARPAAIEDVQLKLSKEAKRKNLLTYHYGGDGELVIQLVKSDTIYQQRILDETLIEKIQDLRHRLLNQNEIDTLSNKIYQTVLGPIEGKIEANVDLVIVTGAVLSHLPFDLLIDDQGRFLCEKYNICYAVSSTLYANNEKPKRKNQLKLIAYVPEFNPNPDSVSRSADIILKDNTLNPLKGAKEESKLIVDLFSGKLKSGLEATERNFKEEAANFDIIHLATHSIVNESNFDYTKMIMEQDEMEDGHLHAFEIVNMNLNAQLVTLSACNTGFGKIRKGEGVMSLSRAFAYAGVPATVVSLWPASDKSTPELMKYFYQNLKEGQRKSEALNNARKEYLATATGKARHPFYWGGFVVIGDDSPITSENSYVAMILSILFLLTAVPIVLVIKNKYLSID